ncbi:hypothetical protein HDV05_008100 [Chytridiales sp. JEL 0842]|nr:hypothetical protein HDV05_008100 [Chytridiales sp. JEL 0842]
MPPQHQQHPSSRSPSSPRSPSKLLLLLLTTTTFLSLSSTTSAQQVPPTCTPNTYTGTICPSTVMTAYQLATPPDLQVSTDQTLNQTLSVLGPVRALSPTCFDALQAFACGLAYPSCNQGTTQLICKSSCEQALAICTPVFAQIGQTEQLRAAVNCDRVSALNPIPLGVDGQCLVPVGLAPSTAAAGTTTPSSNTTISCPAPFLPRTSTAFNKNCNKQTNCCLPCPVQNFVYPVNSFRTVVLAINIGQGISALLCAYVVLSWAVLPGRRQHPGDIVLHFSIAVMIWQSCTFFLMGNPKRIQCADDVTVSTASNNTLCAFQGAVIMTAVHATVLWAGYMIWNLHATIVWRSQIFERFKPLGVILCWGLPGVFTFIPFLLSNVDATTGITCLVEPAKANTFFFSFQAPVVIVSFFLNIATMIHIWIVARRSTSMNSSSNNNYSSNGGSTSKPISARRQMLQLMKLNWRALFLGLVFLITYITYVIFFNIVVAPISNTSAETQWVKDWVLCMVTTNADQNLCAERFKEYIPAFGWIVVANVCIASVGLWIFVIFGSNLALLRDWGVFLTDGWRRKGKNRVEDNVEWK